MSLCERLRNLLFGSNAQMIIEGVETVVGPAATAAAKAAATAAVEEAKKAITEAAEEAKKAVTDAAEVVTDVTKVVTDVTKTVIDMVPGASANAVVVDAALAVAAVNDAALAVAAAVADAAKAQEIPDEKHLIELSLIAENSKYAPEKI